MNAMTVYLSLVTSLVIVVPAQQAAPAAKAPWTVAATGRAIDEQGKPVGDAIVELFAWHSTVPLATAIRVDAAGNFAASWPVPAGIDVVSLVVSAPKRMAAQVALFDHQGWWGRAECGDVGAVLLPAGASLPGVVRAKDGAPLAGVRVVGTDALQSLVQPGTAWNESGQGGAFATTDRQGRFELHGIGACGARLTFELDGYFIHEVPLAIFGDPLIVELVQGGLVTGRVVDGNGRPCRAWVHAYHEVGMGAQTRTDADGRFRLNLDHPHRYRVNAFVVNSNMFCQSEVLDGPANDLTLRPAQPEPIPGPSRTFTIRTVAAATGKAIENAVAVALWGDESDHMPFGADPLDIPWAQVPPVERRPGEVVLPAPAESQPHEGVVLVRADGFAPCRVPVQWVEDAPVVVEALLVAEAVIAGTVRDEAGKAVAGAVLRLGDPSERASPWFDRSDAKPGTRVTDDQGRFRLGGLAAGEYRVHARAGNGPPSNCHDVRLADAEQRELSLTLPRGATFAGRLVGVERWPAAKVVLRRSDAGSHHDPSFDSDLDHRAVLTGDTFEFRGLERGDYELELLVPPPGGRGGELQLPIEPIRVRRSDLRREIDLAEVQPGTVRGTVALRGAALPNVRLAVLASPSQDHDSSFWRAEAPLIAPVGADGWFTLQVPPGEHRLTLIDLLTRIPLAVGKSVRVEEGRSIEAALAAELVSVQVDLSPQNAGGPIVASRLAVEPQFDRDGDSGNRFGEQLVGVSLARGTTSFVLVLAAVPTKLRVCTDAGNLQLDGGGDVASELAEHEFTPKAGSADQVRLQVAPPPELSRQ